jgi:tetraacyldisaccharide 4'-kinase
MPILLSPLAGIYGAAARLRQVRPRPWRVPVPVLCVGNIVTGGAGKTPVAMAAATRLAARGVNAHFLTRGYGGREKGPVLADPRLHSARDVGDEPLLLARLRPTWVARDRAAAARAAVAAGAEVLIMDDGFQNSSLVKDFSLLVVDGVYGFGNRRILPAGPLRETLEDGFSRADAIVAIGPIREETALYLPDNMPVLSARLVPGSSAKKIAVKRVVAFSGIARPGKFFESLEEIGCIIVSRWEFPDHHPFKQREIDNLIKESQTKEARLVTTTKDAVRLTADQRIAVDVLEVNLKFDQPDKFEQVLDMLVAAVQEG